MILTVSIIYQYIAAFDHAEIASVFGPFEQR